MRARFRIEREPAGVATSAVSVQSIIGLGALLAFRCDAGTERYQ